MKESTMRTMRWIAFVPIAAIVAIAFGVIWGQLFSTAYISKKNLFVYIAGVAPLFLGRLLPVLIFVLLGAVIAPKRGRVQIALLGVLGGVYAWPFGPEYYVSPGADTIYLIEALGDLFGVAVSMLIAFVWWSKGGNKGAGFKSLG